MLPDNKNLKDCSRKLRKNMTDAERLLWSRITRKQLKGYQLYRQKILGNFIVDFYCPAARLVVELDGGQHYHQQGKEKDRARDNYMAKQGLRVLRFSDGEVFSELEAVTATIWEEL
jgi:very-short-patch-repair endonuclease